MTWALKIYCVIFGQEPAQPLTDDEMLLAVYKRLLEKRQGVSAAVRFNFFCGNVITSITVDGQDYHTEMLLPRFLEQLRLPDLDAACEAVLRSGTFAMVNDLDQLCKQQQRHIHRLESSMRESQVLGIPSIYSSDGVSQL